MSKSLEQENLQSMQDRQQRAREREDVARIAAATCNGALGMSRQMAGAGSLAIESASEQEEREVRLEAVRRQEIQAGRFDR